MKRMRTAILLVTALSLCGCMAQEKPAPDSTPTPEPVRQAVWAAEPPPPYGMGNEPGVIAAGGYTVREQIKRRGEDGKLHDDYTLYAALADGIYKGEEEGGFVRICEDNASCLNLWEGRLYYINTFEKEGKLCEEIVSVSTEGKDRKVHAGALPVEGMQITEDQFPYGVNCTLKNGYTDLHLGENVLYYIADRDLNGMDGGIHISTEESSARWLRYESVHALCALDLATGVSIVMDDDLGNGAGRMILGDDSGGYGFMRYTEVYDDGKGAQQTIIKQLDRVGDENAEKSPEVFMISSGEIAGLTGKSYFVGRGLEGEDTLRIEYLFTDETDPPWENMPDIAQPLITEQDIYWLSGEKAGDGWENVMLMRSKQDGSKMRHDPVAEIGSVTAESEFSRFSLSEHGKTYLRTENALYVVQNPEGKELKAIVKLIDTNLD